MPKLVILQTPNDRKQQRRMAEPFRSGLPEQFATGFILERTKLRAMPLDGRRDPTVADDMRLINARLHFHLRVTSSVAICLRTLQADVAERMIIKN